MKPILIVTGAAALAACGQGGDNGAAANNAAAANAAAEAAKPKHPTYCFFPDPTQTKDFAAKAGKDGNVEVTGKAHLEDRRYMGALTEPDVEGTSASVWLTMPQNNTGFGAQGDWWDLKLTIPASTAVTEVKVMCGTHTMATLQVPRKAK